MTDVLKQLVPAVSTMRLAQKKYFSNRSQSNLNAAKDAEAEVDRLLLLVAPASPSVRDDLATQGRLFG